MFRVRVVSFLLCLACLAGLCLQVSAAETDCDAVYCFGAEDFAQTDETLAGICITQLPDPATGTAMLGNRILRKGDILTADQVAQMTFLPLLTQQDTQAQLCYLPIYENRVDRAATMTLSIRGKEDKAPVAQDFTIETYKNLPNQAVLKVNDPEGQSMTFSLIRPPKRGQVEIAADGTFTYTPKKNKVGVDSFVYTATDPAGNVSRQATVTIQILKPTDSRLYQDTAGSLYRFEAEWLRNTGLFTGETLAGQLCFQPEKAVSRGEFLTMAVKALDVPLTETANSTLPSDTPQWLRPYMTAAQRSGLLEGLPLQNDQFCPDQAITGAEAALILQNALDLTIGSTALETVSIAEDVPDWATASVTVMSAYQLDMAWNGPLNRAQCAHILYEATELAITAPGTAVFRLDN